MVNTDYPQFLVRHYTAHMGLANASYEDQIRARNESLFGVFDAYSRSFRAAGHEAWEVHVNNSHLQSQWMRENGFTPGIRSVAGGTPGLGSRIRRRILARLKPRWADSSWTLRSPFELQGWTLGEMLQAQIAQLKPDVILNQSVSEVGSDLLMPMRRHTALIVGQIASPLPDIEDYSAYDMMVSSLPNFVSHFRQRGIDAHLNRLGFDPRVLAIAGPVERSVNVSFVGSLSPAHADRIRILEYLARKTEIVIWGNGVERLDQDSAIHKCYQGEAWGIDMFRSLGMSKITINTHIGIAANHANNMRLYEATGMGCLLITDRKSDIAEIFEPNKEVVCYDSPYECAELINYYSRHHSERDRIARAGQRRTLIEHNYENRIRELATLFSAKLTPG